MSVHTNYRFSETDLHSDSEIFNSRHHAGAWAWTQGSDSVAAYGRLIGDRKDREVAADFSSRGEGPGIRSSADSVLVPLCHQHRA